MSRSSLGVVKAVASSSRSAVRPVARSYATMSGNITSVDPRILEGMKGFLPKQEMDRICEWQKGLWERLQAEVRNHVGLLDIRQKWDRSGVDMTQLVATTAAQAELTLAYNYGALLLNNSYFLENLTAGETETAPLVYRHLEDRVAAYADAMVGSGYLWICQTGRNRDELDVIPTFGSGTLLIASRAQRGRGNLPIFMTPSTSQAKDEDPSFMTTPQLDFPDEGLKTRRTTAIEDRVRRAYRPRGSADEWPMPLACLNMFESAWLGEKYGVWDKEQYARDWWKSLDWGKIVRRSRLD